jgi:hypothetical protein
LTHLLDGSNYPSGIIHIDASGFGMDDLLQALFDSFFDSDPSYKPTTTEIRRTLQDVKALIFLDDLEIKQDEVTSFIDAAPNSLFILSSVERSLWGEGEIISLRGLPEEECIKLFERELSRPPNEQEKEIASQICTALQGHPLHILQMASLARETSKPLETVLREIKNEHATDVSLANISMASLGDSEKGILALLAAAGGNIVSLEHVKKIFPTGSTQKSIDILLSLGLVQAHSPRISLTGTLAASISNLWDISSWQDILLRYFINWLSQQPAQALVEESTDALIHSIKKAGEKKQWREVIQLGRALEKFVVIYKRWQTWSDILNLILTAAKALGDHKVEAWALHQLGSRALVLGYANEAKTLLSQALDLRQVIGDKAGRAITQHNLNTLNGIITTTPKNSGCKKYLTYGCGTAVGLVILTGILWATISYLLPEPMIPPTTEPVITKTFTVTPTFTFTPVITNTPSKTPIKTSTPTPTPAPVLLYDFIESANTAEWFSEFDGEQAVDFFAEPQFPSPEIYLEESGFTLGYIGWQPKANLMGERPQKQLLLTFPNMADNLYGVYSNVFVSEPAPDAHLEVLAGYKDLFSNDSDGIIFRIYVNEVLVMEETVIASKNDPTLDLPNIPVNIFEGINIVKLEVSAIGTTIQDRAAWAVVKLWK